MGRDRGEQTPNHLDGETSPYLLQHVLNPVDWYPWGARAHDEARKENKPIFLSIGYAACHWCHVMERESFENAEIAGLLNRHFVSIKVDREERPDIDEIYMNAVQLMTGAGGWPLSAFLTPDLEPFFTGTYFPPEDRYGRPGFGSLLRGIHLAWTSRREELTTSAGEITEKLRAIANGTDPGKTGAPIDAGRQMLAVAEWTQRFDSRWGGFGSAPKFPADGAIAVLLREHHRSGEALPLQMATRTLDAMAAGGLYDHVGGGFSRYSVDERWLVPHFEKMLYNQALLVPLYVDAYKTTRRERYRRTVEETLEFVRREMTDPTDGFHSSLDADSEGEEGKFYVWTPQEIKTALGSDEAEFYCKLYGIDATGNFEGRSIPNLLGGTVEEQSEELGLLAERSIERIRADHHHLLNARAERVRPGTDDKILSAWNGLMITAFAKAYQTFGHPPDLDSAKKSVEFITAQMMKGDRLRVSYRQGRAKLNAYLDDYAFFARGALDLYEACFDPAYLSLAERVARSLVTHFEDRENGGFWFVSHDHEELIARSRTAHDGALPSGAGVATELLIRLGAHLADRPFREAAERALVAYRPAVERSPAAFASMLIAADWARGPLTEVSVVGDLTHAATRQLLAAVHTRFIPRLVLAAGPSVSGGRSLPMLVGKSPIDDGPTAFVCRDYACRAPVNSVEALTEQLDRS